MSLGHDKSEKPSMAKIPFSFKNQALKHHQSVQKTEKLSLLLYKILPKQPSVLPLIITEHRLPDNCRSFMAFKP